MRHSKRRIREEHDLPQGEELDYSEGLGDDQPPPAPPFLTPLPKDFPGREKANLSIWFGDSKIRNKSGAPLRMFHGTNADFSAFRVAPGGMYGAGIYFTDDPDMASNYAKNPGAFGKSIEDLTTTPNVMPVYLRVIRPLVVPGGYPNDSLSFMARSAGYDGIVIRNPGHPFHVVVVFDPRQVKSASGNVGDYDWRSEDVTTEGQLSEALLRRVIRSTLLNESARAEIGGAYADVDVEGSLYNFGNALLGNTRAGVKSPLLTQLLTLFGNKTADNQPIEPLLTGTAITFIMEYKDDMWRVSAGVKAIPGMEPLEALPPHAPITSAAGVAWKRNSRLWSGAQPPDTLLDSFKQQITAGLDTVGYSTFASALGADGGAQLCLTCKVGEISLRHCTPPPRIA